MILPVTSGPTNDRPILLCGTLPSERLGTPAGRDKVALTAYEEFSPVTLIGRAIGVFPLRLNPVSTDQVLFGTSRRALIYPLILLGLTLIHLVCVPFATDIAENAVATARNVSADENDTVGKVDPNQIVRIVNPMAISIVAVASRVNSLTKVRRHLPRIFDTMNDVDRLSKLGSTRKVGRTSREVWLFVVLNLAIGLPSQIFSVLFVHGASTYLVGLWIFMDNFNDLTAVSSEFQFLALCCLLRSRFRLVNLKLLEAKRWSESGKRVGQRDGDELLLSRRKLDDEGFLADNRIRSNHISILRVCHQRLCDALDRVNDVFEAQLLFSMCGCFLNLLFNIYFLLRTGYWNGTCVNVWAIGSFGREDVNFMTHPLRNVSWAIYYVMRFVVIASMASRTTHEAKQALLHILKIRSTAWDYATKEQLRLFHDHIMARRIKFSAAGFYDVDVSLISSAVATGSTYLVIMVQFLNK